MKSSRPSRPSLGRGNPRGGFALLLTVTLLSFIVILLLGLAVYTRVETAVAGNTQRQAQARENALLALNVALGQLQKYAGPDQRVTATADAFPSGPATRHYTGVWNAAADDAAPLTWLVSGNELLDADGGSLPLAITPETGVTAANGIALVGTNTSGTANDVMARLVPITAAGVPGVSGATATIGRYAWWVGDQGVKAPVALPDATNAVDYAPFDSAELRSRLRQQISVGAGAADASGNAVFEPRDANNASLVANQKVSAANQVAFLRTAGATSLLGLARVQQNYHAWSPNNFAVLANTKLGGLRQDLSVDSSLLGSELQSWLDYTTYTEPAVVGGEGGPSPGYSDPALRRRYLLRSESPNISPVLSFFLLTFNVRTVGGSPGVRPLEVRARWAMSLWNPYTGSLVPANLRLEVSGLPRIRVDDETSGAGGAVAGFSLEAAYGSPLKISLPWDGKAKAGTDSDRASWLPGRVYTWTSLEETSGSAPPDGYASNFYSRDIATDAKSGVIVPAPGSGTVDGDHLCHVDGEATSLRVRLFSEGSDVPLATFESPAFDAFHTTPQRIGDNGYQFSYVFRLGESLDGAPWLTTSAVDPHSGALSAASFVYQTTVSNPSDPSSFDNYSKVSSPDRLLDRAGDGSSYNEDVPVFELPRAPLLTLGALQHLTLPGQRPFAIGNSWVGDSALSGVPAAELFDRYFFSGLVGSMAPTTASAALLLPNPLLKVLRAPGTGAVVTASDLQGSPEARSSRLLLQGGAFNLNSTNVAAWAAVLRGVRFPAQPASIYQNGAFTFLDADAATGTAADTALAVVQSTDAQFFRFPQSAQETYKAEPGLAAGSDPSAANTHLFRQGMRTLTAEQVALLATKITDSIKARQAAVTPFRSLQEFLAPVAAGGPSLLEQAILDANINVDASGNPIEFSSQFLTQADIMTALAPVLFPRSDTFVIRTYGEAVNPATSATEGRAWCEAVVQRVPEYFDPSQPAETAPADLNDLNTRFGRRFKVVSFRWLTRADI